MNKIKDWQLLIIIAIFVIILTQGLIVYAFLRESQEHKFGGILFNPYDGFSYFSKMQQGFSGKWEFTLPYTSYHKQGSYLFIFYIFLGHLSKWLNFKIPYLFHLVRLIGSCWLIIASYRFITIFFNSKKSVHWAIIYGLFCSGLGWLLLPLDVVPPDFWLAEAFPFLSMYANPHFPIGLALMLELSLMILKPLRNSTLFYLIKIFVLNCLLSLILPFGALLMIGLFMTWSIYVIWRMFYLDHYVDKNTLKKLWLINLSNLIGGGIVIAYQTWITFTDPILKQWNIQNITLSPDVFQMFVALSPAILLAIIGTYQSVRISDPKYQFLVIWVIVAFILAYFPINLQRRFFIGVYIPITILAFIGMEHIIDIIVKEYRSLKKYTLLLPMFVLSFLTNIIMLFSTQQAIEGYDPNIYLDMDEYRALQWINENTDLNSIILASPEIGLFIPAYTGRKVVYGHPFETINADKEKQFLLDFFKKAGALEGEENIFVEFYEKEIDYIFWGPREKILSGFEKFESNRLKTQVVYQNVDVKILEVK